MTLVCAEGSGEVAHLSSLDLERNPRPTLATLQRALDALEVLQRPPGPTPLIHILRLRAAGSSHERRRERLELDRKSVV